MAIIQYTALVNQIRGKLNGSVFNRSRNANTLQSKQMPPKRLSSLQSRHRAVFSSVQRSWKTLSSPNHAAASLAAANNPTVDRFGNEVVLSGYNHWVKANLIRRQAGLEILDQLITSPAPPIYADFIDSTIVWEESGDGLYDVSIGADMDLTGQSNVSWVIMGYISFPTSPGVTNYNGRWFYSGSQSFNKSAADPMNIEFATNHEMSAVWPAPSGDEIVLGRFDIWQMHRGAKAFSVILPLERV